MPSSSIPNCDIDLFSDAALLNPYPHYQILRETGPVVWLDRIDAYAITRFNDVRAALRNWQGYSSAHGVSLNDAANAVGGIMTITSDPPSHTAMRALSSKPITPAAVRQLSQQVMQEAESLADRIVAMGSFDAVGDLAWHLPLTIVSHLVGVPEEIRQKMAGWGAAAFDGAGPATSRSARNMTMMQEFFGFLMNPELQQQLKPGSWGHRLFEAADRDEISREACPMLLGDYLIPSMDTTVSAIASVIEFLGRHPRQWDEIRADPSLIPNAILEAIRLETPIPWFSRLVTQETEIDGVRLPQNARVMLIYAAANRDDRKWENPDAFNIHRKAIEQLGFGHGIHICMGMHLAQLEIRSLLQALAKRVRRFELGTPTRLPNTGIRSLASLPVVAIAA